MMFGGGMSKEDEARVRALEEGLAKALARIEALERRNAPRGEERFELSKKDQGDLMASLDAMTQAKTGGTAPAVASAAPSAPEERSSPGEDKRFELSGEEMDRLLGR